ncbi:MAG: helicase [Cressdnaviricota sp.]|nr:MAG: helicase [Cressdnaviricota sp.]
MSRIRNFVFTINNYLPETIIRLSVEELLAPHVSYMVFATEVGVSGTPHLQGYCELSTARTFPSFINLLSVGPCHPHLEARRGTQKQAVDYVKKDEAHYSEFDHVKTVYEWGVPKATHSSQGTSKNKALPFKDMLFSQGLSAVSNDPECNYTTLKHVREYLTINEAPRDRSLPLSVIWYHGPTGTGKTRRAYYECELAGVTPYVKSSSGKWFDGYDGESHVIFDDLRDNWFEFSFLLKLLDRYPHRVECKGGSRQWKPTTVFITSPKPPTEYYKTMQANDEHDSIKQLLRRITTIINMDTEWVPPVPLAQGSPSSSVEVDLLTPPPSPSRYQLFQMPYVAPAANIFEAIRRCPAVSDLPIPTQTFHCPSPPLTQRPPFLRLQDLVSDEED